MRKFNLIVAIGITFNVLSSTNPLLAAENEPERRNSLSRLKDFRILHPIGITPERMVSDGTSPDSPPPAPHPSKESTPSFSSWPENTLLESSTTPPAA